MHFKTAEECKKVHNQRELTCEGKQLVILYAKKTSAAKKADNRPQELEKKGNLFDTSISMTFVNKAVEIKDIKQCIN